MRDEFKKLEIMWLIGDIAKILTVAIVVVVCISLFFGCAEIPDREMNEYYKQCIMINENEAFCA